MLFDHIKDELKRISEEKGKPLSRASTAGKWLCQDLLNSIGLPSLRTHVRDLKRNLPVIVMEVGKDQSNPSAVQRKLVSPEDLASIPHFWTVESRLVDSLGIISRDLGRELSLFEFLNALAPDYGELDFSPILPDAHFFAEDITENHYPSVTQFSRRYQQTAIKWLPGVGLSIKERSRNIMFEEIVFRQKIQEEMQIIGKAEGVEVGPPSGNESIAVADLSGDETGVCVVQTRMVTIFANGSEIAHVYEAIESALRASKLQNKPAVCAILLNLTTILHLLTQSSGQNTRLQLGYGSTSILVLWNRFAVRANKMLRESGQDTVVPETAGFISPEMVFNASSYWRDWHRTEKK